MATGVQTKPKTITTSAAEERPITEIVKEAVQFTQTRLDALRTAPTAPASPVTVQERRWPLVIGLSVAAAVSLTLWCGLFALVAH